MRPACVALKRCLLIVTDHCVLSLIHTVGPRCCTRHRRSCRRTRRHRRCVRAPPGQPRPFRLRRWLRRQRRRRRRPRRWLSRSRLRLRAATSSLATFSSPSPIGWASRRPPPARPGAFRPPLFSYFFPNPRLSPPDPLLRMQPPRGVGAQVRLLRRGGVPRALHRQRLCARVVPRPRARRLSRPPGGRAAAAQRLGRARRRRGRRVGGVRAAARVPHHQCVAARARPFSTQTRTAEARGPPQFSWTWLGAPRLRRIGLAPPPSRSCTSCGAQRMRSRCRPATPCTKSRRSATRTSRLRVREFTIIRLARHVIMIFYKISPYHPSSLAGFLPPVPDHARAALRFSLALHEVASGVALDPDDPSQGHIRLRIGLHSGPIMSGIVGSLRCGPHRIFSKKETFV